MPRVIFVRDLGQGLNIGRGVNIHTPRPQDPEKLLARSPWETHPWAHKSLGLSYPNNPRCGSTADRCPSETALGGTGGPRVRPRVV